MTKLDSEDFKEKFPHLSEEIEKRKETIRIDGVRTDSKEGEKAAKADRDSGPSVVDFIRLCDTEEEALEIINHMEEEGKIDQKYAAKMRNQLANQGLRSFGSKRQPGEYDYLEQTSE